MFAKIEITGTLEVKTGLHIGGNGAFAAIGAVDSPVIRDVISDDPIIPGSSLKGKLRTLLAKLYNENVAVKPDDDGKCLTELFGSSKNGDIHVGRLLFSDMFLKNKKELEKRNIPRTTEVKFENSINRTTAEATPRQLERIIRGAEFELNLVYEYKDDDTMLRDFEILSNGLKLLQYDYLGGSGSRGYGKVVFRDLSVNTVVGEVDGEIISRCESLLADI